MTVDSGIKNIIQFILQPYMKCSDESNELFIKLVCQNFAMQMKQIKENVTKYRTTSCSQFESLSI